MVDYSKLSVEVTDEPVPARRGRGSDNPAYPFVMQAFQDGKPRKIAPLSLEPKSAGEDSDLSECDRVYRDFASAVQKLKREQGEKFKVVASVTRREVDGAGVVFVSAKNEGERTPDDVAAEEAKPRRRRRNKAESDEATAQ